MAIKIKLSEVRSVLIAGDGWRDIEPGSLEAGRNVVLHDDDSETTELGMGFGFTAIDNVRFAGPLSSLIAVSSGTQPHKVHLPVASPTR
jgi:hypothetical protein